MGQNGQIELGLTAADAPDAGIIAAEQSAISLLFGTVLAGNELLAGKHGAVFKQDGRATAAGILRIGVGGERSGLGDVAMAGRLGA